MELYDRGARNKLPLWKNYDQAAKGVGLKGTNVTSRATLGLDALYSAISADARCKRPCPSMPDARPFRDCATRGSHFPRENPTRVVWTCPSSTVPLLGHRYKYLSTIGSGTFADVIRAEDTFRSGRSVAIKVLNIGCEAIGIRELRCMRFLGSTPHAESRPVVRMLDALTFQGHVCLVMELLDGTLHPYTRWSAGRGPEGASASPSMHDDGLHALGAPRSWKEGLGKGPGSPRSHAALSDLDRTRSTHANNVASDCEGAVGGESPGACPVRVIRHVALQLVSALLLLHDHGLIHADIKPKNVLLGIEGEVGCGGGVRPSRLDDCMRGVAVAGLVFACSAARFRVKLCDFSNAIHRSEASQYYNDFDIQTLAYRAPEVLMGCPFGTAIDTWSVGIILLELLIGRSLFRTSGSRAALLRQTFCALGPIPLRRFRVGRYFSEYFNQDQSLKDGDEEEFVGCCACCWLREEGKVEDGNRGQLGGQSCSSSCAKRCRLPNLNVRTSGKSRAAETGDALPGHRGATFPSIRNEASAPELPSWQVAHAHLCRLVRAADADASMRKGGSSKSGGSREHGPRSPGIARRHPYLLSFLAGMLCFDPDERLTPLQALAHPFFSEVLPFTVPAPRALGAFPKIVKLEEPAPASSVASSPSTSGVGRLGNNSTTRRCDGEIIIPARKSWGDMIKLSSSLPRPLPTNGTPNQLRSAVGSIFQDSSCDSASVKPITGATQDCALVPSQTKEISYDGSTSSSAVSGMRSVRKVSSTPLARLADTAEAVARRSSGAVQGRNHEGGCSNGASSTDKPTMRRRPNRYLNAPRLARSTPGISLGPVRSEAGSAPGVSIKLSTGRATTMSPETPSAEATLGHESDANPRSHRDGAGCRSGTLKPTVSQQDRHPNTSLLAEYNWLVSPPGETTEAKINSAPTPAPAAPPPPASIVANPGRRPRNRFLTPATLAKLNPGLRDKIAEAMATAEREVITHKDTAASAKSPAKRVGIDETHEDDKSPKPKRLWREQQEKSIVSANKKSPPKERHKQSRRSTRGQSTRGGRARASMANGPGRKGFTPRRAAVASGLALSRSRSEDSDSDCRGR